MKYVFYFYNCGRYGPIKTITSGSVAFYVFIGLERRKNANSSGLSRDDDTVLVRGSSEFVDLGS